MTCKDCPVCGRVAELIISGDDIEVVFETGDVDYCIDKRGRDVLVHDSVPAIE